MKRDDLIKCIMIGFQEGTDDRENEDNPNYDPVINELPIEGDEAQYAWEFGLTMGREDMEIVSGDMDEYLEQILEDCQSKLTVDKLL